MRIGRRNAQGLIAPILPVRQKKIFHQNIFLEVEECVKHIRKRKKPKRGMNKSIAVCGNLAVD